MVLFWQVKSLVDLAIGAMLQGIVDKCPPSYSSGQVEEADSIDDGEATANKGQQDEGAPAKKKRRIESKSNDSVANIRNQLNEYLVSSYSPVRQTLVERFFITYCTQIDVAFNHQLHLFFLDCVLDNTFTSNALTESITLGTENGILTKTGCLSKKRPLPFPDPIQLLKVIANRSPLLKTLQLSFCLPSNSAPPGKTFCLMLGKLKHLTSLTLSFGTVSDSLEFYSSLGQSCPQLANLHLGEVPFETDQVLALILGEKRSLLPPDFPKTFDKLIDVQFNPECLSPICHSLMELHYQCDESKEICQYPPMAFILRHFRELERFVLKDCKHRRSVNQLGNTSANAILHWHNQLGLRKSDRLLRSQTNKKSSKEWGLIQWSVGVAFTGKIYYSLLSIKPFAFKSNLILIFF